MTVANPSRKRKHSKAKAEHAKRPKTQNGEKRVVDVSALPWQNVEIHQMFEDSEGFYGLQEVTGVTINRQGDKIQFMADARAVDPKEYDEFDGFDDLPQADAKEAQAGDLTTPEALPKKEEAEKGKATAKERKKEKRVTEKGMGKNETSKEENMDELESNVFTQLGEAEDVPEDVEMSQWLTLDLSPRILSSISRLKFSKPTPIQSQAIPEIAQGSDVIGKAATGSGKTLAFAIPIVEKWLVQADAKKASEHDHSPIALILSPTRELAHQITNHIKELCAGLPTSPYICSVTGGLSVLKQQRQLEKADIVIATPGRFWEVLRTSKKLLAAFQGIRFLVVDEADRLLTDGHFKEAEEIFDALDREEKDEDDDYDDEEEEAPNRRQTLVFSATFNKGLQQKLAGQGKGRYNVLAEAQSVEDLLKKIKFQGEPKFVDVNPISQMAAGLKQGLIECGGLEKDLYLYATLVLQPARRTLVFANSIGSVRRLTPFLQNLNLPAVSLHSDMAQKARLRSIERFTAPRHSGITTPAILVATDVAARGLDIPGIDLVIHYHVPRTADMYVHRSGRTARAGSSGISVLLCGPEEVVPTRRLVARVHAAAELRAAADKTVPPKSKAAANFFLRTVDIDRRIISGLRERVVLAKKLADAALAKEKGRKDHGWMKSMADELGVEYESDELEKAASWNGRGSGRKAKAKEARDMPKHEMNVLRADLRALLAKRMNTGVSERYLGQGQLDVDELLRGDKGNFLGVVGGLGLEDM